MSRRFALFVLAIGLACSSEKATGVDAAVGVYVLQSVDGSPLPFLVDNKDGIRIDVLSDRYSLNDDGTYSEQSSYRVTQASTVTTSQPIEAGTWTRNGTKITLKIGSSSSGSTGSYAVTLTGSTLTVSSVGGVWLYTRSGA